MEEKEEKPDFLYNQQAKEILTYLFLKDFHDRFMRVVDKISMYLADYDTYNTYFGKVREAIIREIKQDLLSVIYVLNSINFSPEVKAKLARLTSNIDKIIHADILEKEQLKELLKILGEIIAFTFLRDIIKYVPPLTQRIKGDFDR